MITCKRPDHKTTLYENAKRFSNKKIISFTILIMLSYKIQSIPSCYHKNELTCCKDLIIMSTQVKTGRQSESRWARYR